MRTLILVLASLSLFLIFQSCGLEDNFNISPLTPQLVKDTIVCSEEYCGTCCNNGYPTDCQQSPLRSLHYGNPIQETCISCECCKALWNYYGGQLPPAEQIPEWIFINLCPVEPNYEF